MVLLIDLEGMSDQAVADIFDVPIGTIRSRLSRVRAQLRRQIGMQMIQWTGWQRKLPDPPADDDEKEN